MIIPAIILTTNDSDIKNTISQPTCNISNSNVVFIITVLLHQTEIRPSI